MGLCAVSSQLGVARTPLLQQGANEDARLQVEDQVVRLVGLGLGPGELHHAASGTCSGSTCCGGVVAERGSVNSPASTAPAAAIAASA